MRELKHQHKYVIFSGIIVFIKDSIIPLFVILASVGKKIVNKHGGKYILVLLVIVFFVLIIGLAILKWKRNVYSIEGESIYIKDGIFKTHERVLHFSQVHSADISSSLVQRLFNVYKLEIDTAGGDDKSEISILLPRDEAMEIKNIVFNKHKKEDENKEQVLQEESTKKITSSLNDLFIMATLSGRILVGFFIIIAFYSKIDDVLPKEFKRRVQVYSEGVITGAKGISVIKYVVVLVFIMIVISWIISIIVTIIKYYNFTVTREEDIIKLSYGLFDKKEVTIPIRRIQSLIIIEGIIKKPLGYFSLNVETIGYGKDKGESTMICPIARRRMLNKFFEDILPEMNITYDLRKSPKKALKAYMFFRSLDEFVLMAIIAVFVPYGYYIFITGPFLVFWHYIKFNDNGLYYADNFVVMTYRSLSKKTVIINKECIQSTETLQNIFQKKKDIAKYKVAIAGDILGKSYEVEYMDINYLKDIG